MTDSEMVFFIHSSTCCNAYVRIGGKGTTHWWVCTECAQPCDITQTPNQFQTSAKLGVPCSAPSTTGTSPSS